MDGIGPHRNRPVDACYAQVNIASVGLGRKKRHCIRNHRMKIAVLDIALALEQVPEVPDDIHRKAIGLPDCGVNAAVIGNQRAIGTGSH